MNARMEHDLIGGMEIPASALYGIHSARALANFNLAGRTVRPGLIHAYGSVKLAAALVNHDLQPWKQDVFEAIKTACGEMIAGRLDEHIVVDALQGGAGTSTNMNVNEVIANRALQLLGRLPGDYSVIDPVDDINRHQSTNDTYPTALHVAAIYGIRSLEKQLVRLMESFQRKEKEFSGVVKTGRTQLQEAVLTTMGRTMSCFAEAVSRDRWRVYKCEERLRVVNLGGTAIGSGLGAPRQYIFNAVNKLRELTQIGLARAENLTDATQNHDVLVEVSGILSACAVNLMKICGDIRLMSSGPAAGLCEITLPAMQAGSSIMPGKVNPVIPEAVIQSSLKVIGNHNTISQACAMGNLELNAFLPLVADLLLENITLLDRSAGVLAEKCIDGLRVDAEGCAKGANSEIPVAAALVSRLGYGAVQDCLVDSRRRGVSLKTVLAEKGLMDSAALDAILEPESVLRLGDPEIQT